MDGRAIALAIPFFFALIAVELIADKRRRARKADPLYRFADSLGSLACGIGQQALQVFALSAIGIGIYTAVYEAFHLVPLAMSSPLAWALAFVATDFCYWLYHWASHRVNFFWAMHVVHHSSEEYNLSTALRQSWFTNLVSWVFYLPLAIIGVPPLMFVLSLTLNILYQFWIHTRVIGKLGWFERLFNTPSHHRVHHGIDPEYIDKNYAGVFIVWDKLCGTFVEEKNEPSYGTVKPLASFNPFWANIEGFAHLWEMSRQTKSLKDKLLVWVKPPEWRPDDLGGVVTVPPVDKVNRKKYDVPPRRRVFGYIVGQFAVVSAILFGLLWYKATLPPIVIALGGVAVMAALGVWGGLLEERKWAFPIELARLALIVASGFLIARFTTLPQGSSLATIAIAAGVAVGLGSGVWLVSTVRTRSSPAGRPVDPADAQ